MGLRPPLPASRESNQPLVASFLQKQAVEKGVEKGDRHHLPERPFGCFAQMVPVPFFDGLSSSQFLPETGEGDWKKENDLLECGAEDRPTSVLWGCYHLLSAR
jgi:hypothetical protein